MYATPNLQTKQINEAINMTTLVASFRRWERDYYDELSELYRTFHKLLMSFKSIDEAEKYSFLYHQVSIWEYHMDILLYGDDEAKLALFREMDPWNLR